MNKIINALLAAKFPQMDLVALLEVINATPSPEIATELLCGLYESPVIPETPGENFIKKNPREENIKFLRYDKFEGKVHYSYQERRRKSAIILKGAERPAYDQVIEARYNDADTAAKVGVSVEEFKKNYEIVDVYGDLKPAYTSHTSLSTWSE